MSRLSFVQWLDQHRAPSAGYQTAGSTQPEANQEQSNSGGLTAQGCQAALRQLRAYNAAGCGVEKRRRGRQELLLQIRSPVQGQAALAITLAQVQAPLTALHLRVCKGANMCSLQATAVLQTLSTPVLELPVGTLKHSREQPCLLQAAGCPGAVLPCNAPPLPASESFASMQGTPASCSCWRCQTTGAAGLGAAA